MTASSLILSYGSYSVDFAVIGGVNLSHRFSNPVVYFDTVDDATEAIGANTKAIDLGLVRHSFDLTFQLRDGPGTFNFVTPSTNYEKIVWMARKKNPKTLTLNGTSYPCHIDSFDIPWDAGKKDLTTQGTMTVTITDDIQMEE